MTSHAAGPDSIPGRVNFVVEVFLRDIPSTVRQMSGNFGHIRPQLSYGQHISVYGRRRSLTIAVVHGRRKK